MNVRKTLRMMCYAASVVLCCLSCGPNVRYRIGVSQCSEDDWREALNSELHREARFMGNVDVDVRTARDNSALQVSQIDSLVEEGCDLLIVAPNVAHEIEPAIERAFQAGVPIVMLDRHIEKECYTAFVGADNVQIGREVADYMATHAAGREATVMEMGGLEDSSPAEERHRGFAERLSAHANLHLVTHLFADWNEPTAERLMDSLLQIYPMPDYIFAQNDRMGSGIRHAVEKAAARAAKNGETCSKATPYIIGIDALLKDGCGVDMVLDGQFLATHIYPAGGTEAMRLALNILRGEPYERYTTLPSAMVDSRNARVMKLQYRSMCTEEARYTQLVEETDQQLQRINLQRAILFGSMGLIILLGVVLVMMWKWMSERRVASEMMIAQLHSLVEAHSQLLNAPSNPSPDDDPNGPDAPNDPYALDDPSDPTSLDDKTNDTFLRQVENIIERRISDSELSVNEIADELHISRVQLYRKIKALSESNVNEMIRRARLRRARHLLLTTDKNISEVAYEVGFSSPSYFTKCYKEFFGEIPSKKK